MGPSSGHSDIIPGHGVEQYPVTPDGGRPTPVRSGLRGGRGPHDVQVQVHCRGLLVARKSKSYFYVHTFYNDVPL